MVDRGVKTACKFEGFHNYTTWDAKNSYPICAGNAPIYEQKLSYVRSFLQYNKSPRKAAFVCFDEPHYPGYMFPELDRQLKSFIREMTNRTSKPLSSSALILWADHGIHYGKELSTLGGLDAHKQPLHGFYYQEPLRPHIQKLFWLYHVMQRA